MTSSSKTLRLLLLAVLTISAASCSFDKMYQMGMRRKTYSTEQISFKDVVNRYVEKNQTSVGTLEGIYSVTIVITRKGKGLLASTESEKVTERRENYSKVAVIRDTGNPNREFMEVSLDNEYLPSWPVSGEFVRSSGSALFVYKHIEPNGKTTAYTFVYDRTTDLLEGVRTENKGNFTYTYKLTYLKLTPKGQTAN